MFEITDMSIQYSKLGTPTRKKDMKEGSNSPARTSEAIQESKISFVCQRCLQPIRIDPSFYSMNEHVQAELTLPLGYGRSPASPRTQNDTDSESKTCGENLPIDRIVQPFQPLSADASNPTSRSTNGAADHDFTLVGESGQPANVTTIR